MCSSPRNRKIKHHRPVKLSRRKKTRNALHARKLAKINYHSRSKTTTKKNKFREKKPHKIVKFTTIVSSSSLNHILADLFIMLVIDLSNMSINKIIYFFKCWWQKRLERGKEKNNAKNMVFFLIFALMANASRWITRVLMINLPIPVTLSPFI